MSDLSFFFFRFLISRYGFRHPFSVRFFVIPTIEALLYLSADADARLFVSAIRLLYGSAMVSGLELATLSFVHSWEYVFFDAVVELFFSSLLASSPRLVSFDLLVAACRFFPSNGQLVDELAVLVDPRSVYGLASPEPAHQAALQAAFFRAALLVDATDCGSA